jgi:HD-like signal output (HDOD) protein
MAGILLLDPWTNELHLKLDDFVGPDEEISEIWDLLSDDIHRQNRELGGEQLLHLFEQTWSNIFRIGERHKVTFSNPEEALAVLFNEQLGAAASAHPRSECNAGAQSKQEDLRAARKQLPKSPQIAGAALRAIRSDRPTNKVAEIIHEDPVLAAGLVRLGNSALHRHRGPEVRSVAEAIDRLGTNLVQRQILASCMGSLFSSVQLRSVWNHSVDVAAISRQLGALSKHRELDELVLLGLVHDIGRIVFATLGNSCKELASLQEDGKISLLEAEEMVYGTGHPEVGADLLTDWNFPSDMIEAVRNHHRPRESKSALSSLLYLAESWVEGNEDVWQVPDHAYAISRVQLSPYYFRSLAVNSDNELDALRLAA